jgi:hypothetical protein
VQQLSVPLPPAPQLVRPAPLTWQLVAVVVEPVHCPAEQVLVAHVHGVPCCPHASHACTAPPEHPTVLGVHTGAAHEQAPHVHPEEQI